MKGIIGAITAGRKPEAKATTLGKKAIRIAPWTPVKITARKRAAFTKGPVIACTPTRGAKRTPENKTVKQAISNVNTFFSAIALIFIFFFLFGFTNK